MQSAEVSWMCLGRAIVQACLMGGGVLLAQGCGSIAREIVEPATNTIIAEDDRVPEGAQEDVELEVSIRDRMAAARGHAERGEIEQAQALFEGLFSALTECRAPEDEERLAVMHALALVCQQLGNLARAVALLEEVRAIRISTDGPRDPRTLEATTRLAELLVSVRDCTQAVELARTVVDSMDSRNHIDHGQRIRAERVIGVCAFGSNDVAGAQAAFERAHADLVHTAPEDDALRLTNALDLAHMLRLTRDLARARELEEYVLDVRSRVLPTDDPGVLQAAENLSLTLLEFGDLHAALELQERVLAERERLLTPEHPELQRAWQNLARTLNALGDLQAALQLEERLVEVRAQQLPVEHAELLDAQANLAATRAALGDIAGARVLDEHVFAVRSRTLDPDHPRRLAATHALAITRVEAGDAIGALELFEFVYAAYQRLLPPDHVDLLRSQLCVAAASKELGDHQRAIELELDIYATLSRQHTNDHPDVRDAVLNLAGSLLTVGDVRRALLLLEDIHASAERGLAASHPTLLMIKMQLANARSQVGDHRGALELEEFVLEQVEQTHSPNSPLASRIGHNLGNTLEALGEFDRAFELRDSAIRRMEATLPAYHPDLLRARLGLASSLFDSGDSERALELQLEIHAALARSQPLDSELVTNARFDLGVTLMALGRPEDAGQYFDDVCAVWTKRLESGDTRLVKIHHNLAVTRNALGDHAGQHSSCSAMLAQLVQRAASSARDPTRASRTGLREELKRLAAPLFWNASLESKGLPSLVPQIFVALEALRETSVRSAGSIRAVAKDQRLARLRGELVRARTNVASASAHMPETVDAMEEWRRELVRLADERDRIERMLLTELAARGVIVQPLALEQIRDALAPNAALVTYLRHTRLRSNEEPVNSLLAFVVTADGQVQLLDLGPVAPIELLLQEWRALLGSSIAERSPGIEIESDTADDLVESVGGKLREAVLDPIIAVAPAIGKLHVIPDDFLHLLAFDALPLGQGIVGNRLRVHMLSSASQLSLGDVREPLARDLIAVGGVDYACSPPSASIDSIFEALLDNDAVASLASTYRQLTLVDLPETEREVQVVTELFGRAASGTAHRLTGALATKECLREAAPSARYLHIATHGWFASCDMASVSEEQNTMEVEIEAVVDQARDTIEVFLPETLCGLALAGANSGPGGILTAEELATIDLSNCEIAVLSACETNVGLRSAGQGIQSLQTALHAAGARTAITSLWKVDDTATRKLFELFYTNLWRDKLGSADALWQAKMALRSAGHPLRDWAGWVLTGSPD